MKMLTITIQSRDKDYVEQTNVGVVTVEVGHGTITFGTYDKRVHEQWRAALTAAKKHFSEG